MSSRKYVARLVPLRMSDVDSEGGKNASLGELKDQLSRAGILVPGGFGTTALACLQPCRKAGKYVGICGQGPSDSPMFAEELVEQGIDSLSLNPDTVIDTWPYNCRITAERAAATVVANAINSSVARAQ